MCPEVGLWLLRGECMGEGSRSGMGAFHMVHREMEVGRQGPGEKWRAELRR